MLCSRNEKRIAREKIAASRSSQSFEGGVAEFGQFPRPDGREHQYRTAISVAVGGLAILRFSCPALPSADATCAKRNRDLTRGVRGPRLALGISWSRCQCQKSCRIPESRRVRRLRPRLAEFRSSAGLMLASGGSGTLAGYVAWLSKPSRAIVRNCV